MPDHSHDDLSSNTSNVLASEGQIWDLMNPDQRAQLLGQSIAGEANNSVNNSVYQKDSNNGEYAGTPYSSLPPQLQSEVSSRLHEAGYFQDSYGGTSYEVEGEDRFECKDCDDEVFITEEDFRVHRKINHDDNGESETESQEAYFRSLEMDPDMTKDNLEWARKALRGESSRVEYPQNDPSTASDPPLPKGRKEYDDNPNHYFYDNKLFKRGSRGGNYEQTGTALTEARALIELEEKILNKYGWESTKDIEKSPESRDVFARAIANEVNINNLHPRTIRILDSVHRPFLVNTLSKLAQETDAEDRGDKAPFIEEEPVLHQDYDPEHPHEHNTFDTNFGDKVAEEEDDSYKDMLSKKNTLAGLGDYKLEEHPDEGLAYQKGQEEDNGQKEVEDFVDTSVADIFKEMPEQPQAEEDGEGGFWQDPTNYEVDVDEYTKTGEPVAKLPTDKRANEEEKDVHGTCPTCGFYSADEEELHSHVQDHTDSKQAQEDFPFEDQEEQTTVTAEPDLLQNVNTDVLQVEAEDYDPDEEYDDKAEEARILREYTGYQPKAGEALGDILEGAIDTPVEQQSVDDTIYDRKLEGYHEDKIARELAVYHEVEYEDAIERIRSIEVNYNDITAKTLFGKKFADCNEAEISEMKILGGEAKKRSKGEKND